MKRKRTEAHVGPIKRNIPVPPRSTSLYSAVTHAIHEMKKGDHRVIDGPQRDIARAALTSATRFGYKITTRKLNGEGLGIWRLE